MYAFHTETGQGFVVMHYERIEKSGVLILPKYLGHTVVKTEVDTPKTRLPEGFLLPASFYAGSGKIDSTEERLIMRSEKVAAADKYPTLEDFITQGKNYWDDLLDNTTSLSARSRLAENKRVVDKKEGYTQTDSGLLVATTGTVEDALYPQQDQEFASWVATPVEIESIEAITAAVQNKIGAQENPDSGFGNYM